MGKPTEHSRNEQLLNVQDQVADLVATLTGARQQLIAAGWSENGAEAIVIEMFRKTPS